MSADELTYMLNYSAGVVIGLILDWLPGLNEAYAGFSKNVKRLIAIGLSAVVALIIFAASCTGLYNTVECSEQGALLLAKAFFGVLVGSVSWFIAGPKPKRVEDAKKSRDK